jgi:Ca2+/Na+ antiporter
MGQDGAEVLDIEDEAKTNASNKKKGQRATVGIQLGSLQKSGVGNEAPLLSAGGLLLYSHMSEVKIMSEGVLLLEFSKGLYHTTLQVKCQNSDDRQKLVQLIQDEDDKTWVHDYDPTICGAAKRLVHELSHAGIFTKLFAIPEFIIDGALRLTLSSVDVKQVQKEGRWPLCFCGAMAWLAVFSFLMLEVANQIHANISALPMPFLGITVCAVGTSFPNAVASIIMSSQNKPAAAIANALGSNVQNVFLAMALPWVIFILTKQGSGDESIKKETGDLKVDVEGINEGVMWMLVTLIILLIMVFPTGCKIRKWMGYFLCILYVAWLILTSAESFKMIAPLLP